jgi:hypothetical protein
MAAGQLQGRGDVVAKRPPQNPHHKVQQQVWLQDRRHLLPDLSHGP